MVCVVACIPCGHWSVSRSERDCVVVVECAPSVAVASDVSCIYLVTLGNPSGPLYDHETDPQICEKDHMKETDRYESIRKETNNSVTGEVHSV